MKCQKGERSRCQPYQKRSPQTVPTVAPSPPRKALDALPDVRSIHSSPMVVYFYRPRPPVVVLRGTGKITDHAPHSAKEGTPDSHGIVDITIPKTFLRIRHTCDLIPWSSRRRYHVTHHASYDSDMLFRRVYPPSDHKGESVYFFFYYLYPSKTPCIKSYFIPYTGSCSTIIISESAPIEKTSLGR